MCRRVYVTPWCPACLTPGHPYKVETQYCWNSGYFPWSERPTFINQDREDDWRPPHANYVCHARNRDLPLGRREMALEIGMTSNGSVRVILGLPGPEAVWINPDRCWNCLRRLLDRVDRQERSTREKSEEEQERGMKRKLKEYVSGGTQTEPESEQAVGGEISGGEGREGVDRSS